MRAGFLLLCVAAFCGCVCSTAPEVHTVTFDGAQPQTPASAPPSMPPVPPEQAAKQPVASASAQSPQFPSTTDVTRLVPSHSASPSSSSTSDLIVTQYPTETTEASPSSSTFSYASTLRDQRMHDGDAECFDSDGGLNVDIAGRVEYNGQSLEDRCEGDSMYENYCDNEDKPSVLTIICGHGCFDGTCLPGTSNPSTSTYD
jgi:hypothetical protein